MGLSGGFIGLSGWGGGDGFRVAGFGGGCGGGVVCARLGGDANGGCAGWALPGAVLSAVLAALLA